MRSMPQTLAEPGPGDSLGVGLAALLSGISNYYALDIVRFSSPERNSKVFEELVSLFKARAARQSKGWPDYDAYLDVGLPRIVFCPTKFSRGRYARKGFIRSALLWKT
jgi:hypothetical protein